MPTRLGQNFLKDNNIIQKIIQAAELTPDDFVIEIGPGKGILTAELSKIAGKILAIEIDKALAFYLQEKFARNKRVEIINEDILKINFPQLIKDYGLKAKSYKVIANIPYYITSPIIRLFLESEIPPQEMILMVQKEVAERIVASPSEIPAESRGVKRISRGKPGKMSILALSVQYYAKARILFPVSSQAFFPVPDVESAVIKITPHLKRNRPQEVKNFFRVVRAGFSAKRKTLVNNLANSFHKDKKSIEDNLNQSGLTPLIRAQELSLEDWKKLSTIL